MLCSYVVGVRFNGHRRLDKKIPSVFQIQDFIETAWDHGINSQGRVETGGIRGTRKYIGTPEVCPQCTGGMTTNRGLWKVNADRKLRLSPGTSHV